MHWDEALVGALVIIWACAMMFGYFVLTGWWGISGLIAFFALICAVKYFGDWYA